MQVGNLEAKLCFSLCSSVRVQSSIWCGLGAGGHVFVVCSCLTLYAAKRPLNEVSWCETLPLSVQM